MTIMMSARLTVVMQLSGKVSLRKLPNITAASAQHLNPLRLKHILSSLSHISGKHDLYTHLPKHRRNSALAPASLRRSQLVLRNNIPVNNGKNSIISTMSKMVINPSISRRYSNFHHIILLFKSSATKHAANLLKIRQTAPA